MNVLTLKNHNNDVFPKWASFQTWTIFSCFIICCRLTSVMKRNCKCVYSQPTVEAPEFNKRDQYHGSVLSRRLERCEACTTVDHNIKYLLKTWAFFFCVQTFICPLVTKMFSLLVHVRLKALAFFFCLISPHFILPPPRLLQSPILCPSSPLKNKQTNKHFNLNHLYFLVSRKFVHLRLSFCTPASGFLCRMIIKTHNFIT